MVSAAGVEAAALAPFCSGLVALEAGFLAFLLAMVVDGRGVPALRFVLGSL